MADDNFKFDENGRKLSKPVENTVGKGEIARYKQFLLFPQCFQKACFPGASKGVIVWEWDNCLPNDKALAQPKSKVIADDKINVPQKKRNLFLERKKTLWEKEMLVICIFSFFIFFFFQKPSSSGSSLLPQGQAFFLRVVKRDCAVKGKFKFGLKIVC